MARSSSSVVTPISSAAAKASRVFSGANPRAPRWPCRSNAMASAPAMMLAATIAALAQFAKGAPGLPFPRRGNRESATRTVKSYYDRLRANTQKLARGASSPENRTRALADQAERDEEDQEIGDLVEQLGRRAPGEPEAEKVGRDRERQEQGRGRERAGRELAEREIGRDLHHVHQGEEDDGGADQGQLDDPLPKHLSL